LLRKWEPTQPTGCNLPPASSSNQYTRKGRFYSESSPEVNNWSFYKGLQWVYHNLSNAGDQAQCPKHMSKCLASDSYPPVQWWEIAPQNGHYTL
jgi:hypothetical protein